MTSSAGTERRAGGLPRSLLKAASWAFSQAAERTCSPTSAALLNTPPNRLLAASSADDTPPTAHGRKRVFVPLPHRPQENTN